MNSGSAETAAVLRCEPRGSAIVCGSVICRSIRLWIICRTVVMIVEPPGEPRATAGFPSRRMIVGDIDERGRLPGSMRFGSFGS